jgi:hypothetical protein
MIYLDVISKINAESKHASGLDLPCLAGKAEEVRSRNSEVRSQRSEVGSQKSEVGPRPSSSAIVVDVLETTVLRNLDIGDQYAHTAQKYF